MGLEVFRCYLALLLRRRTNVKIGSIYNPERQWFKLRPLWLNYKQLNLKVYNIVPRVGPRSVSMSAFFGKIAKFWCPDPKTNVPFLRNEKTVRVDPTFWFWTFYLLADFIPNLTMIFIALFSLGWTKGARKTHCWWGKWQSKKWVGCRYRFGWWSRWNYTDNITCWSTAT